MRLWQQHHVHLCRRRQVHGHDRRQNNVTMSLSMLANCCAQHLRCLHTCFHTCYFCHLLHWYDTPTAKHLYCSIPQFHSSTTTIICWSLVTYIYCRNNWTDECPLAATQRESIVCRKPGASSEHESTAKRSETANIRTRITGATSAKHAQIKIPFNTAHRWNVPEFTSCYVCSAYKWKSCLSMHTIWVKYILEPRPQTSSHLYTHVHACVHSSITTIIARSVVRELLFKQIYKQSVSKLVPHINAALSASRIHHRALTDRRAIL